MRPILNAALVALLTLPWSAGCPADDDDGDDTAGDDDVADDDGADDDGGDDDGSGALDCTQKEHNAADGIDVAFQDFDVSWCQPIYPVLSFTIDTQTEWQELIDEKCTVQGTPPPPPDWFELMIVGTVTRDSGCQGHAESQWFVEKQEERVYAYVMDRDGDCEEEITLGVAVTTVRSLKVTRFVQCDYQF